MSLTGITLEAGNANSCCFPIIDYVFYIVLNVHRLRLVTLHMLSVIPIMKIFVIDLGIYLLVL